MLATGVTSFAQGPTTPASQQPAAQNANAISGGQPSLYNATGSNGAAAGQDSFKGSIVSGKSTGTVIDLSLDEAIQRGLRQNLGIILQGSSIQSANGQRLQQLQQLLPTVTAGASIEVEQVNLAAYGFKFNGLKPIVGPFQVIDFRLEFVDAVDEPFHRFGISGRFVFRSGILSERKTPNRRFRQNDE